MRALILSSEFPPGPGGIGAHAHLLARSLNRRGWQVTVVAPQDYASPAAVDEFNAAQPFRIRSTGGDGRLQRAVLRVASTRAAIRSTGPDLIIATGAAPLFLVACTPVRRPVVAFAHGSEITTTNRWRRLFARAGFRRADLIVCPSDLVRARLRALDPTLNAVSVVPLGADPGALAPASAQRAARFRNRIGISSSMMILSVGTVSERKGQDVAVRALPGLTERHDVHYVCVGREHSPGRLAALADELGVAGRVHVLGQLPPAELADAYAACDVFALLSRETRSGDIEGFGIAAVEAAIFERPLVVSDATGVAESVEHGVTGLVVAADDLPDAERALDSLLASADRRRELGHAAHRMATTTLSMQRLEARYDEILRGLTEAPHGDGDRRSRLVVVSDTPHFRAPDGQLVGWGPTVRELDHLAPLFCELVHVAPVHPGAPPRTALPYQSGRVRVRAVQPAGGTGLRAKLGVLGQVPSWARTVRREIRWGSAVHVRGPSNISLVSLLLLAVVRRPAPRWLKYAGNWAPTANDHASYWLQRWLLRSDWCRAVVTVNGKWPDQPRHVRPFVNPSLTDLELERGAQLAKKKTLEHQVRLLFVGALNDAKGAGRSVEIVDQLAAMGLDVRLDLAGDGPNRLQYESDVRRRGIADRVIFHGWLERAALDQRYADAHIVLLPSLSEGFPKVIAEGMAYGAVPVVSDVSSVAVELATARCGIALPANDVAAFVAAIADLARSGRWEAEREAAVLGARRYAYGPYVEEVRALFSTNDAL